MPENPSQPERFSIKLDDNGTGKARVPKGQYDMAAYSVGRPEM
jgi:hypothetical protein